MLVESEVGLSTRHVLQDISAKEMGMGISKEYRKRDVCTHIIRRLPCTQQKHGTETGRNSQGTV